MTSPDGVAVDQAGDVFVADGTDRANSRVLQLPDGASTPTTLPFTGLRGPTGLAVDQSGDVFVSDNANWRVLELPHAVGKQVVLPFPSGPSGLGLPYGVAATAARRRVRGR